MPYLNTLTQRETEVLYLISFSYNSPEIAQKLRISRHTVNTHRKKLLLKLDTKTSAGLIRRGFEYGILKSSIRFLDQTA